ncbi:hypothetical protein NA57DRAFT_65882 [Rhizodiscina lignyota]|uniref:WSC domain-containing protein n=1 Tax=Rhizodiscina lignyota TaxID=1504668 RepID=A0A9P4MA83_9PEZI|nr:hypothetical protein NA57DRAFT_65882 [Rhizodiscina lignyota]
MSISEGTQISSGTFTGKMEASTTVGCFATPTPLVDHGSYEFQSSGNCQKVCYELQQPVMGLTSGTNCSCGPLLPPKDSQVDDDKCSTGCAGYDKESCGGADYWWVILTGFSRNEIANLDPHSISTSSAATKHSVVTIGGSTVVKTIPDPSQTAAPQKTASSGGGGGTNKAGIAAGVVVGVVVLIALIAGVVLFLKRRKRRLQEEEYQQKQSVQQFVSGGKGVYGGNSASSMNDSRLDPEVMMSRRQSDGSIADNQDYSRRILRVR